MDKKQKKVLFEMIYEEVSAVVDQMLLEQEEPKDEEPPPDEEDGSEGGDAPIEAEEPPAPKVELGMSPSIGGAGSVPVSPTAPEVPETKTEQQTPAQPAAPLEPPENVLQKTATNFFNELPASKNQPDPVQYLLNVAKQQIQDNYENIDDALPLVTLLAQDKNQDVKDVAKRLATFILCV